MFVENASRLCRLDNSWDITNYTACDNMDSEDPEFVPGVEVTSAIYFAGYTLSLVTLAVAVWLFLYFK